MPVTLSFELEDTLHGQAELGSLFERLGWEPLGPATYRYPVLVADEGRPVLEDWFNHVVPALMFFRCYVLTHRLIVKNFTLDVNSSTGYRRGAEVGTPPLRAENIRLRAPAKSKPPRGGGDAAVAEQQWLAMEDWLDATDFPLTSFN